MYIYIYINTSGGIYYMYESYIYRLHVPLEKRPPTL